MSPTTTKKVAAAVVEAPTTKKAAVCNACGAVYKPAIYDRWGKEYGRGLGSVPCCEALRSNYNRPVTINKMMPEKSMHPVGICRGSLSIQDVPIDTVENVLATSDTNMVKRGDIMREKQATKSPALRLMLENVKRAAVPVDEDDDWAA